MKKIISLALSFLFCLNLIFSSAQGLYNTYFETFRPITSDLNYVSYYGEDSDSDIQTVHILEYTSGNGTLPYVAWGSSLMSFNTVSSMMKQTLSRSLNAVAGINGDFYSFYTGIPLSVIISDGKVISSDAGNNAIGFYPDGSVIVGTPAMSIELSFNYTEEKPEETESITDEDAEKTDISFITDESDGGEQDITDEGTHSLSYSSQVHFNKYPTVYSAYLMDSGYSDSTESSFPCLEFVMTAETDIVAGTDVKFTVLEIYDTEGNTSIPEGAFVLTVPKVLKDFSVFEKIKVGDTLTLSVRCDEEWEGVETAIGGGDIFVRDGKFLPETVNEFHEMYANARSAVGVREDGSVFFLTFDGDGKNGRGVSLVELGEFMISQGAVFALNLDGGGSSTVAVSFPDENTIEIVNNPKDTTARRVSNAFLFINAYEDSENPSFVSFDTYKTFLLSGSSLHIQPTIFSSSGSAVQLQYYDVKYTSSNPSSYFEDGIYYSSDGTYTDRFTAYFEFPDNTVEAYGVINVTDVIDSLELEENSAVLASTDTFTLSFNVSRYGIPVSSSPDVFVYSVTDDNSDGDYELSDGILFENDYITVASDGTVTAKKVPVFTEAELVISYKDKECKLKLYFGKEPDIIEDFEYETVLDGFANSSDISIVSGYKSEKALYSKTGTLSYKQPKKLDIKPKYVTLFVEGTYSEDLSLVIRDSEKTYVVPYGIYKDYSAITGWVQLFAAIPEDTHGNIEILSLTYTEKENAVTVDSFASHYGWSEEPFSDISGTWSHDYIIQLYDMGIVDGYFEDGETVFKPDNNITRAEFAKMLASYLSLDIKSYSSYGTDFSDADAIAEWAAEYIMALSSEGYMNGKPADDGSIIFDSDSYITREEAMYVLSKLLEVTSETDLFDFSDGDSIQEWAFEAVKKVVNAGIVTGFDDGTIRAGSPVTRAQMCTMFTRLWNASENF